MDNIAIGIDLGTANSAIAYFDGKESKIIPNIFGETTIPSKVIWNRDGRFYVGREAINHPDRYECENFTIGSIKRKMDQPGGFILSGRRHYPSIVSALILAELKSQAEAYLKTKVDEAVICIPCNFGVMQRYATIEAAEMAGIKVLRILNEATAAAVAFSHLSDPKDAKDDKELIFDLGAGTLDLSLVEYGQGFIEVNGIGGEEFLGGDDFDERIINWIVEETKKTQGFDPIEDQQFYWHHIAKLRLKEAAEKAKIELSSQDRARIHIPYIRNILGKKQHIDLEITDSIFESICKDLIDKAVKSVGDFPEAKTAGIARYQNVRMARKKKVDMRRFRDKLLMRKPELKEVNEEYTKSIPIEDKCKLIFTGGASKMKCIKSAIYTKYYDRFNFIHRDKELVAMGASIQAGIFKGFRENKIVIDCTPKSIGMETLGGVYTKIIPKFSHIPVRELKTFTTTVDNQEYIHVAVYEGESPMASGNRKLIDLKFGPLLKAAKGVPKIEVTFDINVNNILTVDVKDPGTGKQMTEVVKASQYTMLDPKLKNTIKVLIEKWLAKRRTINN